MPSEGNPGTSEHGARPIQEVPMQQFNWLGRRYDITRLLTDIRDGAITPELIDLSTEFVGKTARRAARRSRPLSPVDLNSLRPAVRQLGRSRAQRHARRRGAEGPRPRGLPAALSKQPDRAVSSGRRDSPTRVGDRTTTGLCITPRCAGQTLIRHAKTVKSSYELIGLIFWVVISRPPPGYLLGQRP